MEVKTYERFSTEVVFKHINIDEKQVPSTEWMKTILLQI